jgi:hypothetical protein
MAVPMYLCRGERNPDPDLRTVAYQCNPFDYGFQLISPGFGVRAHTVKMSTETLCVVISIIAPNPE